MAEIGIIKFQLENMNFCMYADRIVEIVRYPGVRKIPKPLPYVVGLFKLRKHIVTVVDFRKRLGLSPFSLTRDSIMIVATLSSGTYGLIVNAISDFRRIPETAILPPIAIAGFPEYLLKGVVAEEDDIMPIPDLDTIFGSYIKIHLTPITPSEKIAFQYRFTPGALPQTLEKNLLSRQRLDYTMVRQLPRALCVPSVQVHRMVTHHADFLPQTPADEQRDEKIWGQTLRAGDEKYASLSQKLSSDQDMPHERSSERISRVSPEEIVQRLLSESHASGSALLEQVLHTIARFGEQVLLSGSGRTDIRRPEPELGRQVAKTLKRPSVRVTKYLSYYLSSRAGRGKMSPNGHGGLSRGLSAEEHLAKLLQSSQRDTTAKEAPQALLLTMQTLQQSGVAITPKLLKQLCLMFRISPVYIAKLASFFPEYEVAVDISSSHDTVSADIASPVTVAEDRKPAKPQPVALAFKPSAMSLSTCLWNLADQQQLSDDRYVRHVASRLRVSTCRLSKLRRYYRWNNEQTD